MMKKSEIQLTINILTGQFKVDVDSNYLIGQIVAYRSILGENGYGINVYNVIRIAEAKRITFVGIKNPLP